MYFSPGFLNSIRETDARPSSASGCATNPSGNAAEATALVFLRDAEVDGSAVVDHRTMESLSPLASSTSSFAAVIGFGWMNEGMRAILCACSFLPSFLPASSYDVGDDGHVRTNETNERRSNERVGASSNAQPSEEKRWESVFRGMHSTNERMGI